MGFAVRVRSAGQKYGPTCHQRDRADVTEFVTLVRLSSRGQHVGVLPLAGYKRRKSALTAGPIWHRIPCWLPPCQNRCRQFPLYIHPTTRCKRGTCVVCSLIHKHHFALLRRPELHKVFQLLHPSQTLKRCSSEEEENHFSATVLSHLSSSIRFKLWGLWNSVKRQTDAAFLGLLCWLGVFFPRFGFYLEYFCI